MLYIHNTIIFTPVKTITNGALLTDGASIAAVGPASEILCPPNARKIDAAGKYLTPGFIDLQLNGGFGNDFTAGPESIWPVAVKLPQYGVTSFLPTIITSPPETVAKAQAVVKNPHPNPSGEKTASHPKGREVFLAPLPVSGREAVSSPEIDANAKRFLLQRLLHQGGQNAIPLGLHVEGPFLNPKKKGAHNPNYLRPPTLEAIENCSPEKGVKLVTLAPELPGAAEVIAALVERGVVVSAGHSLATFAEAEAGFEAGIRYGTHLFNAMPPLRHREPGLIDALLADDRLTVGLIPDGIHVHPSLVKMAWRALGPSRLNLVTDAMAALGKPPGRYIIGDLDVIVDEHISRLPDGTLAGSILPLDAALRNLIAYTGCSLSEALPTITTTPARLLGLSGQRGELTPGAFADLVLLSGDLEVKMTVVEGKVIIG